MPRPVSNHPKSAVLTPGRKNKFDKLINKMNSKRPERLTGGADMPESSQGINISEENANEETVISESTVMTESNIRSETNVRPEEEKSVNEFHDDTSVGDAPVNDAPVNDAPANDAPVDGANKGSNDEEIVDLQNFSSLKSTLTSDKEVDELIQYVQKNLREACEALACLGDNIEHEIKLMFVDVIGQIRKWVSSTEDKLERSISKTSALQKAFKDKIDSLAECETNIYTLKSHLRVFETQNATLEKALSQLKQQIPGTTSTLQQEKLNAKDDTDTQRENTLPDSAIARRVNSGNPRDSSQDISDDPDYALRRTSSKIDNTMREDIRKEPSQRETEFMRKEPSQREAEFMGKEPSQREAEFMRKEPSQREIEVLLLNLKLEKELECLKKENERLIKERTEYENAVQRALLKGVSSLNVEALRVMRNPPTCYDPCSSPSTLIEPLTPCVGRNTQQDCFGLKTSHCSDSQNIKKTHGKKSCNNTNCPSMKHRKKHHQQNLLLLNEKDIHC